MAFGSVAHAFLTHFLLWMEQKLPSESNPEIPAFTLLDLARNFFIEALLVFAHCLLYPMGLRQLLPRLTVHEKKPTPILLVHGYLHNQISWLWFARQLRKHMNIGPIYTLNLSPPLASIEQLANCVQAKVEEIETTLGTKNVILIGHSMGGLVCSHFAEHLATPDTVKSVITIGTPFQGTRTAVLGFGENANEMMPHTAYVSELKQRIEKSSVPYYTILSKMDNLIIPWQSALLDTATEERRLILADQGHLQLLLSSRVIQQVLKWVKV